MSSISWDSQNQRFFEAGLDRVVLYPVDGPGVPFYGVVSLEEKPSGGEIESFYIDQRKYLMISSYEEFGATLAAVNYPVEFRECLGIKHLAYGLMATQQPKKPFGLSYRTKIGSDTKDVGFAYKLHLVYNAMVGPTTITNTTLRDTPSMQSFSWTISTRPVPFPGLTPLSHLVIDSREVEQHYLEYLESFLYGLGNTDPMILNPGEVLSIMSGYTLNVS